MVSLSWNLQYPQFYTPMRLKRIAEPFDSPDYLYEIKLDGWRALALCDGTATRLVSRNANRLRFNALAAAISRTLAGRCAVIDGEVVCLDGDGKPQFYELRHRSAEPYFYAFDILWLDGRDLRNLPLIERKARLAQIVNGDGRVRLVPHVDGRGVDLFRLACENDLEGIVAKRRDGVYLCGERNASSWFKVKNAHYSQAEGRREWFEGRRAASTHS